jgi:hypothetical protein
MKRLIIVKNLASQKKFYSSPCRGAKNNNKKLEINKKTIRLISKDT